MSEESTASVVKNGETCIQISLKRDDAGLRITAKVHPRIENFIRAQAENQTVDLRTISKLWRPVSLDKQLFAYIGGERLGVIALPDVGAFYNVDSVGQPLVTLGSSGKVINLSFLRLAGISEDAGVSFTIRGVHSLDAIKELKGLMAHAARRFYIDYLRPIDVTVTISTQELRS